ncbi:MAG: formylglycine-generating enzyme family protein [Bacteroidia bacterium]|nr:formylglycine-generating enzyme family protein [Bacteroidia bacterium]
MSRRSIINICRNIFLLGVSGFLFLNANSQGSINVAFKQSDKKIIITYGLTGTPSGQTYNIEVFCSTDGGKTYSGSPLTMVSGDLYSVTGGSGKTITWDVLSERESLQGNVAFKMRATPIGGGTNVQNISPAATRKVEIPPSNVNTGNDPYWAEIQEGTFTMGSSTSEVGRASGNEVEHQITLKAFKMGRYEVTFEEYDEFCDATRRRKIPDAGWGRGKHPIMNITWYDAKAFAEWKKCRLPTEAEWEYACRAGTTTPFYTGDNITTDQANYNGAKPYNRGPAGTNRDKTMEVGQFPPNAWGLYDMHGNVSEWCNDVFGPYSPAEQTNPKGPEKGPDRVYRGGNWYDGAVKCRSADRVREDPYRPDRKIGFRLVKDY